MKVLIGVDGSPASFDAVRMAAKLVHPAVDEVAIYFSPSDIHKKLAGRAGDVVQDLTRRFDTWWESLPPYLVNESAAGPTENPFKERYRLQFGKAP